MDQTYDGLPPPDTTVLSDAVVDAIDSIRNALFKVANGIEPAWHLSHGLLCLQLSTSRRSGRIPARHRDRLIASLVEARNSAVGLFATPSEIASAAKGIDAAAVLVVLWSEAQEQRAARHPHIWLDAQARVRILRNLAHNLCLIDDIDDRSDERVVQVVRGVIRMAVAA